MISFVAFSLRRAWQGFWRNAVMSLAATATMVQVSGRGTAQAFLSIAAR